MIHCQAWHTQKKIKEIITYHMKKNKLACAAMASLILMSSCSSSYQASAGVTGAYLGGHIGEAVGFLSGHGHFRGENAALGSLVGMGVGAILGVGIANQIEKNQQHNDGIYHNSDTDYQTGGGAGYDEAGAPNGDYRGTYSKGYTLDSGLEVSDLSYTDSDGDGLISQNEVIEVESVIKNTTDKMMRNVTIWLEVDDAKRCRVSPSLTTTIEPGETIRYTGRVYCKKARSGQRVTVTLCTNYTGLSARGRSMTVSMR